MALLDNYHTGSDQSFVFHSSNKGDLCSVRFPSEKSADHSAIEKVLRYRVRHPVTVPSTFAEKISPVRLLHDLGWMRVMVSRSEAKDVFRRAFSRPPRLLFGNPVCFIFSTYYAYLYGKSG